MAVDSLSPVSIGRKDFLDTLSLSIVVELVVYDFDCAVFAHFYG